MPFKVKFSIYEPGKIAPCLCTQDRRLAYIELNAMRSKPGMATTRMTAEVWGFEPMTKSERFALQLWEVRKAQHKYYNGGRRREDLLASIELESELDRKIKADRHWSWRSGARRGMTASATAAARATTIRCTAR